MNRTRDAILGMFKTVDAFLDVNTTTIIASSVPVITTYKSDLKVRIDAILATSEQTVINTRGITLTKAQAKSKAIKSACIIAGLTYSYAVDTDKIALAEAMKITRPFLEAKKDEEVLDFLRKIWVTVAEIISVTPHAVNPLLHYGVTQDDLNTYKGLITEYADITEGPRLAISVRKTYNQALDKLYNDTDLLLFKLDRIIDSLEGLCTNFYAGYYNARKVVGPMTLSTQIVGVISIVTDAELQTTQVVQGAEITIFAEPYTRIKAGQVIRVEPPLMVIKSDADGKYTQPTRYFLTTYTVTCKLRGYQEMEVANVSIKKGKKTHIDFLLYPIQQPA